jgi:hypothetical protein
MREKLPAKPTDIFALADHDLFASFTRIGRLAVANNQLRLFLRKKPASIPGPLWFTGIGCHLTDPRDRFLAFTSVEAIKEEDGELFLLTCKLKGIPLSDASARRLSQEATLVMESPFNRRYTLNFHALLRVTKTQTRNR